MEKDITVIPASLVKKNGEKEQSLLRVAAYCRVSTDQEEQLGSFQNQVEYYTKLIASHDDWTSAGIFQDEGISGTGTRKRVGFLDMIRACKSGKVDMIITKSVSRFARNTADCLQYSRMLRDIGIPVFFEKEHVNTMEGGGELLFTILSSLAQEESRNISENICWGIRSKMQKGIPHLNTSTFMGYDKDPDGKLVINDAQAEIVRRIYSEFLDGMSLSSIADGLNREGISGVHGKASWSNVTLRRMLENEKHKGDLLMQKYYTVDYLTKELAKNEGKYDQYFIANNHEAIVDNDTWEAAQLELARRREFMVRHGVKHYGNKKGGVLFNRVYCARCGAVYLRRYWKNQQDEPYWYCKNACGKMDSKDKINLNLDAKVAPDTGKMSTRSDDAAKSYCCDADSINQSALENIFCTAWNELVSDCKPISDHERYREKWELMVSNGNPLEKWRGRRMLELLCMSREDIEKHEPDSAVISTLDLIPRVLSEIRIIDSHNANVIFIDGTCRRVQTIATKSKYDKLI